MVLVTFEDVHYSVPGRGRKAEPIEILHGVSGYLRPNELTALMGPSGCGKTTLLDVLAGRKTAGTISGEVLYGGAAPTAGALRQRVGYVEQKDTLCDILTVREMLSYTAALKNDSKMPAADMKALVDTVMEQLRLTECADTVIGNDLKRGVSGGQAKRVNVGLALVTRPDVLFLDEPTTGLDSTMANEVVVVLKELAKSTQCTICATIHSPTGMAFGMFDRLLLLKGGSTTFFGDLSGGGAGLRKFFEGEGFEYPEHMTSYSLCEWVIDIMNGGIGAVTKYAREREAIEAGRTASNAKGFALAADDASAMAERFASSAERKRADEERAALVAAVREEAAQSTTAQRSRIEMTTATRNSSWHALGTLLRWRTAKAMPTPDFLGPRFGDKVLFSFILMSLYWGVGSDVDPQSVQSTTSVLFMATALNGYGAAAYVPTLVLERPLFYRERNDGCYNSLTYLVWKVLEEGLMALLTTTVYCCATYFAIGMQGTFGYYWLTYYLSSVAGIILAYFFASACPNLEVANAALPTYVTIQLFFGGLFITDDNIPDGWRWAAAIDFLRYPFQSFMLNQFQDTDPVFSVGGETILEFYGMEHKTLENQVGYMFIFPCAFFICAYLAIKYIDHSSR